MHPLKTTRELVPEKSRKRIAVQSLTDFGLYRCGLQDFPNVEIKIKCVDDVCVCVFVCLLFLHSFQTWIRYSDMLSEPKNDSSAGFGVPSDDRRVSACFTEGDISAATGNLLDHSRWKTFR